MRRFERGDLEATCEPNGIVRLSSTDGAIVLTLEEVEWLTVGPLSVALNERPPHPPFEPSPETLEATARLAVREGEQGALQL